MRKNVLCIGIEMQKYVKIYHTSTDPVKNSMARPGLIC